MHAREKMFPGNMQAIAWEAAGRACITLGRQCLLTVQNPVRRRGPSAATLTSFGGACGVTLCSVSGASGIHLGRAWEAH